MKYRIALHKSDEGFAVSVPGLPGCWSQGTTEQEAIQNIQDAIRDYLAVVEDEIRGQDVREDRSRGVALPKISGVNHLAAVRALESLVMPAYPSTSSERYYNRL